MTKNQPKIPKEYNEHCFPLGLDFGTSNSTVSWYNKTILKKGPECLNFPLTGSILYPSIALIDNEGKCIRTGLAAYNKRFTAPNDIVMSVKRRIAEPETYNLGNKTLTNIEVAKCIIADFIQELKSVYHDLRPNVIVATTPYYFGEIENYNIREAVISALNEQIGYNPEVFLLPEPIAASLAYILNNKKELNNCTFLVYDIGGGTLDLTLIRASSSDNTFDFEILANDGIQRFGGNDIDEIIYDYIIQQDGYDFSSLSAKLKARNRALLMNEAEQAKRHLTTQKQYDIVCAELSGVHELNDFVITRDTLDDLLQGRNGSKRNMLEELTECIHRLYSKAKIDVSSVDVLVPIGGTSLVPLFHNFIKNCHLDAKEYLSNDATTVFTSVSIGACIYAAMKSDSIYHTDFCPLGTQGKIEKMKTRVPHSLFIQKFDGSLDLIITANAVSPAQVKKTYYPAGYIQDGTFVNINEVPIFQGIGISRKASRKIGDINFNDIKIYSHGRNLKNIPIHLTFEATETLVIVHGKISKGTVNGDDITFNQIIKLN